MNDEPIWYKNYPENVPKTLDYPLKSLADVLIENAREFPNNPALLLAGKQFHTTRITYEQLNRFSTNFAKHLHKLGIQKGDRVALFLPNFPEFVIAFYGIQKLGAIVAPLNIMFTLKELEYHIKDSRAKIVVTINVKSGEHAFLDLIHTVAQNVGQLDHIIVASIKPYIGKVKGFLGGLLGKIVKLNPDDIPFERMIQDDETISYPEPKFDPKTDVAMIPYTGGTTGLPKGVMLTHWNLLTNCYAALHWMIPIYNGLPEKGIHRFLAALPLFHLFGGALAMLLPIFLADEIILVPNPRERKFTELLELIDTYKPSFLPFVPTGFIALLNHPQFKNYDLKSIDFCLTGAAPLPVEVMKQFEEASGSTLLEGWGLTETSPIASANTPLNRKIGSVGIPFIDTSVKIFDLDDKEVELKIGENGELGIKGPQVMKGYWNKPEETCNVMNNQGYFMTGDIGHMDDDGFIYIEDRKKDMIIASGFKVFPREVEEYFFEHPEIENVAIVGIPDKYRGERPKAFIILKQGATCTDIDLMEYAKKGLSKYKVPKEIEIRDSLPLSAVGKVLRRLLREDEKSMLNNNPN
ncbi:MAG: long-chain fatty acid--CoA ligase [Candidatus Heimdallarchaeota archaeon]|nr:MAG: long-chain fatty acid--CoA ligase [Candidatus Heimdallarchaeota archaeon]